jgi:hypothetical protein
LPIFCRLANFDPSIAKESKGAKNKLKRRLQTSTEGKKGKEHLPT